MTKEKIVTKYGKFWPREVFDIFDKNALVVRELRELQEHGVYILYRDDMPYYVGKTKGRLCDRLHAHSNKATDKYFQFWNYFSFFVVPDPNDLDQVEGILIASMPTLNIAQTRKIERIRVPSNIGKVLRRRRKIEVKVNGDN